LLRQPGFIAVGSNLPGLGTIRFARGQVSRARNARRHPLRKRGEHKSASQYRPRLQVPPRPHQRGQNECLNNELSHVNNESILSRHAPDANKNPAGKLMLAISF
jgi:hypothetical protein